MRRFVLIACAKKKLNTKARARELYVSPLFRLSWNYANKLSPAGIFILSAKYGLLVPDREIEPYDVTLNRMSANEIKKWANQVLNQLTEYSDLSRGHFTFLAALKYRKYLIPSMPHSDVPMEGLSIGRQLQYLKRHIYE